MSKSKLLLPGLGGKALSARGFVQPVRADANDPKALIEQINKAFEEFKSEHTKQIDALRKGQADVVTNEKVDRINAAITELQKQADEVARKIAVAQIVKGAGGIELTPEERAYSAAFNNWFRKGDDHLNSLKAAQAALHTGSDPDGGFVVPKEMETAIDRVTTVISAMRRLATVRSIGTKSYTKLVTTTGATAGGWVGEQDTRPETAAPKLSELEFVVMEQYANPYATQTLLDDARVSIEQWLADEVSIVFAEQEGAAFVSGNGVKRPRGITAYTMIADASWAWNNIGFIITGAAADFHATTPGDNIIDLAAALKPQFRPGAVWLMNRTVEAKIRKFKDTTNQYLWQPGLQLGTPASLVGYPVEIDDNMSNVGAAAFPVAFGNFKRAYVIVDRFGIRVLRDPFSSKPYVQFYTTKRTGGGIQHFEAIKFLKCST